MDIEKAFDSVSWEFLLEVLEARGFGRKFRNLISCLLFSSSTRILVNGTLSEPIFHRRGLRQGDPMSPLLFANVMECLAACLALAENNGIDRKSVV